MYRILIVSVLAAACGLSAATLEEVCAAGGAGDFIALRELVREAPDRPGEAAAIVAERISLALFNADMAEYRAALAQFDALEGEPAEMLLRRECWEQRLEAALGDFAAAERRMAAIEERFAAEEEALSPLGRMECLLTRAEDHFGHGRWDAARDAASRVSAFAADSYQAKRMILAAATVTAEIDFMARNHPLREVVPPLLELACELFGGEHPMTAAMKLDYSDPLLYDRDEYFEVLLEAEQILRDRAPDSLALNAILPMGQASFALNYDLDLHGASEEIERMLQYWTPERQGGDLQTAALVDMARLNFGGGGFYSEGDSRAAAAAAKRLAALLDGEWTARQVLGVGIAMTLIDYERENEEYAAAAALARRLRNHVVKYFPGNPALDIRARYEYFMAVEEDSVPARQAGEYEQLAAAAENMPNTDHIRFSILFRLGLLLEGEGDAAAAAAALERATGLLEAVHFAEEPLGGFLWLQLGSARLDAGDRAGAVSALEEAVRIAEMHPSLGSLLAMARQQLREAGKKDDAAEGARLRKRR